MLVVESLANRFLEMKLLVVEILKTFPHLSPAAATSFSPPGCKATEKILSGTTWDLGGFFSVILFCQTFKLSPWQLAQS